MGESRHVAKPHPPGKPCTGTDKARARIVTPKIMLYPNIHLSMHVNLVEHGRNLHVHQSWQYAPPCPH